ncbi:MAG: CoA-binding protein [Dehalococcoidia bacterium]|nr:CoA-binding protein [Dehalococcoidia bacterium]
MDIEKIECIFNPQSVAVIGATDTFGKWGFDLIRAVVKNRGKRKIYPVNIREEEVCGIKSFHRVTDIPETVDFAVIVVPAPHVVSVMRDCAKKGVKAAIVITAGFAEMGEKGKELQKELVSVARDGGIRFIGPNTMGHFSTLSGFDTLTLLPVAFKRGEIGLISQSGNIGGYVLLRGLEEGVGFSKFIGTGNEADLTLEDYLEYLGQDDNTKVIALYIEGLRQGRRFFELAREISKKKPIVALKVGRTSAGMKAAQSHTSALSGADRIYDAMFKQCGVIRVDEVAELYDTAIALLRQPIMKGNRVGILTRGGGFGVLSSDACQARGLDVSTLSPRTIDGLNAILPPYWSHGNPVDTVAATGCTYEALRLMLDDENIDAIYYVAVIDKDPRLNIGRLIDIAPSKREQAERLVAEYNSRELESVDMMLSHMGEYQKPIVFCSSRPGRKPWDSELYHRFRDDGVMIYSAPEDGAKVLARLAEYGRYLRSCG